MLRSLAFVTAACAVLFYASVSSACNAVQSVCAAQVQSFYAAPVVQSYAFVQPQVTYSLPFVQQQAVFAYSQPIVAAQVVQPVVRQRIVQRQRLRVIQPRQRSVIRQRVVVEY